MFNPKYSNQAKKFLKKSDKILVKRLFDKIDGMRETPFPKDTKTVEGYSEKTFRVRVGDYRILYEVDYENKIIGVIKIDKRPRVY